MIDNSLGWLLSESAGTGSQSLERSSICGGGISIERVGGCNQPGVVLGHPTGSAPLKKGASPRLREVQSLNLKSLQ